MAEKQQYTIYKTKFELSPATPEEQGFCFSHEKSAVDEACIGHLRGDFGDTGTAFYHSWWPHNQQLATPTFKRELEDVMTGLRRNGLLKDRKTMLARSMRFRTAIIPGEGRNTMAFRIETQEHLFYLRCNPNKGEYNFYCYGYNKTMLMEVLRQQKQLPRVAWAELDSSHEVVAVCYGESGYHKWEPEGFVAMTPTEIVDALNKKAGVSKAQAAAMKAGSLFGWHCPAADPRNYDDQGRPTYHRITECFYMNINENISALVQYGLDRKLIEPCDKAFIINQLLTPQQLDSFEPAEVRPMPLEQILKNLTDDAVNRGIISDDITSRDLYDTKLMGILTPPPREVRSTFEALYEENPKTATDWFYKFSQDTDYIRRYRIQKDMRWKTVTDYGTLDVTINLSKPEKDPKAIAAAKAAPQSGYPKCQLCAENEGYAGRMNHPARQNHRIIPITIGGKPWYLQYSPYVYYNEHCIAFNAEHTPMKIDKAAFEKLLDFVTIFPHYFIGSNADLPIVGGSILSHEHFQGGCYTFPMEKSPVERKIVFNGFEDVKAGIVKWPMSVIRLTCPDKQRIADLADHILQSWRGYSDADAFIFAETNGEPHNTITPIARRRGEDYEMDLVLRNNITTEEHPLGVFHPHAELHHIKKENIGLIEVMGLAVLPSRLKQELADLEEAILMDKPITGELEKHAKWVQQLKETHTFTTDNTACILKLEVGKVFAKVLEHAGVYKRNMDGEAAFDRFIRYVNRGEKSHKQI